MIQPTRTLQSRGKFLRPHILPPLVLFLSFLILFVPACIKVGPDFVKPDALLSPNWLEAGDSRIDRGPVDYRAWWSVFDDPVLNRLIDTAYQQNLSLRVAGVRVLEARAQLGVAVGNIYPQTQQAFGYLEHNRVSERSPQSGFASNFRYQQAEVGFNISWELDFWGRFRRAVESADATLTATLADYDSALVSLTGDVATVYILIRTLEKRLLIAEQNVAIQKESLAIAEARFEAGTSSQRDVEQAKTLLSDTEATIPALESQLRQAKNGLSVLLGMPPSNLQDLLSGPAGIPVPPSRIAAGIPADLIRRRPDIRSAEFHAAAQSARIGVAKADLFPAFSLFGTFGFLSTDVAGSSVSNISNWSSREYTAGPSFSWKIFNYGRITNSVRVEDARLQELLILYQDTVLRAQQEVEDGLAAFLRSQERAQFLARSVGSAKQSLDLAIAQYREGVTDFTTVLSVQQALLIEQDSLAVTMGNTATSLVATYRALGGGWQIREGKDLLPQEIKEAMAKRTDWGGLLEPAAYMPPDKEGSLIRFPDW